MKEIINEPTIFDWTTIKLVGHTILYANHQNKYENVKGIFNVFVYVMGFK